MGIITKPSKWFHHLFRRCRLSLPSPHHSSPADPNKHAIAVAAVSHAALAAAHAAAEVVRLTSNPPPRRVSNRWSLEDFAAVRIQSAFRAYLARRALKALKGLVKLQALVRGHFVRKQSANMLRRLQTLVRVQDRARANRALSLESPHSDQENPRSYEIHARSEKLEDSPVVKRCGSISSNRGAKGSERRNPGTYWLEHWVEAGSSINSPSSQKIPQSDDEKSDKILEVDSWKPHSKPTKARTRLFQPMQHISVQDCRNRSFAASDYLARYCPNDLLQKPNVSLFSEDVASLKSLHFPLEGYTAESSPHVSFCKVSRAGSMRRSPKTPSRDDCSRSTFNGCASFASPSYMANTESSRAKVRSQSVPRQRGDPDEKQGSIKRSLHAFWQSKTSSKRNSDSFANF